MILCPSGLLHGVKRLEPLRQGRSQTRSWKVCAEPARYLDFDCCLLSLWLPRTLCLRRFLSAHEQAVRKLAVNRHMVGQHVLLSYICMSLELRDYKAYLANVLTTASRKQSKRSLDSRQAHPSCLQWVCHLSQLGSLSQKQADHLHTPNNSVAGCSDVLPASLIAVSFSSFCSSPTTW